jgi:hypothetical protein
MSLNLPKSSDHHRRLEKERLQEVEPKFKRRRIARGVHGIESKSMSIVTPENMEERLVSTMSLSTLSYTVHRAGNERRFPISFSPFECDLFIP